MIMRTTVSSPLTWIAASGMLAATAFAGDVEIVVEATAPVQVEHTHAGPPGGASVDILSVKYRVSVQNLDLTKHADVLKLDEQIKVAAKKACDSIAAQYPTRSLSDAQTCINDAVRSTASQEKELIAAAESGAKK